MNEKMDDNETRSVTQWEKAILKPGRTARNRPAGNSVNAKAASVCDIVLGPDVFPA
jgi:hypothetical protein